MDRKEQVREGPPARKPTTPGLFPHAADLTAGNRNGLYVNWVFFPLVFPLGEEDTSGYRRGSSSSSTQL